MNGGTAEPQSQPREAPRIPEEKQRRKRDWKGVGKQHLVRKGDGVAAQCTAKG